MNINLLFDDFKLPQQKLSALSFCGSKPKQLQELLDSVPSTQIKNISALLCKLLPEINQLNIKAQQRIELLNILRPYIQHCIDGLAEDFLKQPLSLTDNMTQSTVMGQALQRHLSEGYLIGIQQLLPNKRHKPKELATLLFFAIRSLGQLYYRSLQLYVPRPPLFWKKINTLYLLASDHQLEKLTIQDNLLHNRPGMSCERAYCQVLALACSHTNQLRPVDIMHLFNALEAWSELINLPSAQEDDRSIYWIDLKTDKGPIYESRYENPEKNHLYAVNFHHLLDKLGKNSPIIEDIRLSPQCRQALIAHVLQCWQEKWERKNPRLSIEQVMNVSIGLTAGNQQLLNGKNFQEFIQSNTSQSTGFGIPNFSVDQHNDASENRPRLIIEAVATDESSDGYCLRWTQDVPPQIKSGEVILLRKPGQSNWQAGSIRWTQRLNHHIYIGVQLLAGYAEAAAASTTLDNGLDSPFFRSLLLKSSLRGNDTSLLTPSIPFRAKKHITLQLNSGRTKALLTELISSSGHVSQFSYTNLH